MRLLIACALFLCTVAQQAAAAVEFANNINANVTVATSFDANTGLYTYRYTITNFGDSTKLLHEFHIPLRGASVLNLDAPQGWEGSITSDGAFMGWCACSPEGVDIPPGYVDDGKELPSKFAVAPGRTLAGFSFQSAYPPAAGTFYAGAWVATPIEGVDFPEGQEPSIPSFPLNLLAGSVNGPLRDDSLYMGGRRPAADGFLVFANFKDGGSYTGPVVVDILFGQNGENVTQSTFKAALNGVDVTSQFAAIDPNRRRAVFQLIPGSALKSGKNTLITSVDGSVPGSNKKVTDTDRVVFLAQ